MTKHPGSSGLVDSRSSGAAAHAPAALPPAGSPGCEAQSLPEPALHVDSDMFHSCAWERSRGVWCWGDNAEGQLDDGTKEQRTTPAHAQLGSDDLVQLQLGDAPGGGFSCALTSAKTVECWGSNDMGQLGDGTFVSHSTPVVVEGLSDVVELATGISHSCARLADQTVKCWGRGDTCDLGNGCVHSAKPVEIKGLNNATQLAVGTMFSCALTSAANVMCWGGNALGEVGVGDQIAVLAPKQVAGLTDVVRIAAGSSNPCAQTRDGRVFCWGTNRYGFLGVGVKAEAVTTPHEVPNLPCGAVLMPGAKCAVTSAGDAYCWGTQSGDGSKEVHAEGAARVPLEDVVSIAGFRTLFALKRDNTLWAWGYNDRGQLGDGSLANRWSPVQVQLSP